MKPTIAGLVAALLLAVFALPIPPRHVLGEYELLVRAIAYVLAVASASIAASRFFRPPGDLVLGTAAAAIWFAPLAVFLAEGRGWAAVPLILLAATATALFARNRPPAVDPPDVGGIFSTPNPRLLRQLPSSIAASLGLQFAAVAVMFDHPISAAALLAVSTALLSWRATRFQQRLRSPTIPRALGRLAFAILLTILGLLPFLPAHPGSNGNANAAQANDAAPPGDSGGITMESYRGVILFPAIENRVTLVPPLPAMGHDPLRDRKNPLDIPFYGVYWFYRRPGTQPPKNSVEMHGSPVELTFRSHDSRPLVMEAHQNLGALIDLSCCRSIQLAISNRDPLPTTVSVELILVNTLLAEKPFQSLGVLEVHSGGFSTLGRRPAFPEMLDFPIPPATSIQQFDEFTIRFHLLPMRNHESANVAIDRFVLMPK